MHRVGFKVAAIVSDMGPTNIGLWKTLKISPSSSGFNNPVTNKKIYVFADVPHLIKLARNHFIDKGFVLPEDVYIGKQIIEQYLKVSKPSDFKLAYKLSEQHLNVTGSLRQNVKLAAQLFSNGVAKALKYCGENKIIENNNWEKVCKLHS